MTQVILIDGKKTANADLLNSQLKAAAPNDCYGLTVDKDGLNIVVSDTIDGATLQTLKNIAANHDASAKTPAQQAEETAKTEIAAFLAAADKDITLAMVVKVCKHILKRMG